MFRFKNSRIKTFSSHSRSFSDAQIFDFSEFTKSDREKAAEVLVDWRSRSAWEIAPSALSLSSRISSGFGFSWRFFAFLLLPQVMIHPLLKYEHRPTAKRVVRSWCTIHSILFLTLIYYLLPA